MKRLGFDYFSERYRRCLVGPFTRRELLFVVTDPRKTTSTPGVYEQEHDDDYDDARRSGRRPGSRKRQGASHADGSLRQASEVNSSRET